LVSVTFCAFFSVFSLLYIYLRKHLCVTLLWVYCGLTVALLCAMFAMYYRFVVFLLS